MKKHVLSLLIVSLVLLSISVTAFAGDKTIVLRCSTQGGPALSTTMGLVEASEYIKEKSAGKVDLQVFHSGQLANQKTTLQEIQEGGIDMALVNTAWMATRNKPMGVFYAPYIFRNPEHLLKVLNGPIGQKMYAEFEKKSGLKVLDVWYYGTRHATSNIKASVPEEFGKVKMRAPGVKSYIEAVETLGAKPTPIEFAEVYMALKTGTVDAQENPLPTIDKMKFYEVQKYIILTGHLTGNISPIMNMDKWNSLPEDLQKIVVEGLKLGGRNSNARVIDGEKKLLEKFRQEGLEIIEPDLSIFRERAQKVYQEHEKDWGSELIAEIQAVN